MSCAQSWTRIGCVVLSSAVASCGGSGSDSGADPDGAGGGDGDGGGDPNADARHAVTLEGECDLVYTRRFDDDEDDTYTETRSYYAMFDVSASESFRVTRCAWEPVGEEPDPYCPGSTTCTGENPPPADCDVDRGGDFMDGKLRVYCGFESEERADPGGPVATTGYRWETVSVEVE